MILHTKTLKSWGGEQNKVLNELKIHKKSNYKPILVCNPKSQIANRAKKEGIEVIEKEYMTSIGIDENRCKYLPSIVNIEHFEKTSPILRDEFNIPKEHIVLGIFTSLREVKGVFEFAEVAKRVLKRYHNLTVVFGGNYSKSAYEKIYQEYIDSNIDTNRVIWTGFRDDSATIMKDFDIFLFPSHSEGLGTVILEAMASSLPIVVYDIAPMNQLVSDGVNGFCVPYKSIDRLTKRVEELINDNNKRVKFAKNSKEYVSKNYRYEVLQESINKLFKEYNVCT